MQRISCLQIASATAKLSGTLGICFVLLFYHSYMSQSFFFSRIKPPNSQIETWGTPTPTHACRLILQANLYYKCQLKMINLKETVDTLIEKMTSFTFLEIQLQQMNYFFLSALPQPSKIYFTLKYILIFYSLNFKKGSDDFVRQKFYI